MPLTPADVGLVVGCRGGHGPIVTLRHERVLPARKNATGPGRAIDRSHPWPRRQASDRADLLGLRALLALRHLELDALVLVEAAVAVSGNRRVVNKDVSSVAVGGNEAKTLLSVEPLHGALDHRAVSSSGHLPVCTLQTSGRPDGFQNEKAPAVDIPRALKDVREMQLQPRAG